MTIKTKTYSVLAHMTGWSAAKKTAAATRDIVADKTAGAAFAVIKDCILRLKPARSTHSETFAAACTRQGLVPGDLAEIEIRLAESAKLYRWCGYVALLVALVTSFMAPTFYWFLMYLISGLLMTALLAVYAVRDTFRLWQVEHRDLASFSAFCAERGITRALAG